MAMPPAAGRPEIVVFDVNETLLSLRSLGPAFASVLGDASLMGEWFARMLHGSVVSNELDDFRTFATIGVEALRALATKHGVEVSADRATQIVAGMRQLDPHPDVIPGIERLRAAGFRTATLTNGSDEVAAAQMSNAGLAGSMDDSLTVESIGKFKPAAEVYRFAAERFGVDLGQMLMVAAHDWDIAGAANVGCPTAFVTRSGVSWSLPGSPPGVVVRDIVGLAEELGA